MIQSITPTDVFHITNEIDAFYTAYRCFIYHNELNSLPISEPPARNFWRFNQFLLLYSLLINWNKVFGIATQHNRWKEITIENMEFNKQFYAENDYQYSEWSSYRREINELKNSFVQFPDHYHHLKTDYDLKGVENSLYFTHQWLTKIAKQNIDAFDKYELTKWPLTVSDIHTIWKEEFHKAYHK